jgi:glycosyltransferase involved in cell wall biosynthesis
MRVGLDGYPLSEPRTGVGHYTLELARALALNFPADQFELVSPLPFHSSVLEQLDSPPNLLLTKAKSSSLRGHWWSVGLPLYARQAGFDIFHGTNYDVPLWKSRPSVLTIHDLSILLYPKTHERRAVRRGRLRLPLMTRRARAIITVSASVKAEVCDRLQIKPAKVSPIPLAPRSCFQPLSPGRSATTLERLGIAKDFLLFVGTLEPRKNLLTLLKSFGQLRQQQKIEVQLVLAGASGWLMDETFKFVREAGLQDHIRLTGYLPDDDLRALYSSCRAFIYPSLYEGFGLPPLEAMACGAPVIASRIAVLQEVLRDAAIFCEPLDVADLTKAISDLLRDESRRQKLISDGLARASEFDWNKTARRTFQVYQQVLQR